MSDLETKELKDTDKCIELFKFLVLENKKADSEQDCLLYLQGYANIARVVVYGEQQNDQAESEVYQSPD